jgi:hypothetical protein
MPHADEIKGSQFPDLLPQLIELGGDGSYVAPATLGQAGQLIEVLRKQLQQHNRALRSAFEKIERLEALIEERRDLTP